MSDNAVATDAAELYRLGAERYKKSDYDAAIEQFTRALERDPSFYRALVYRGMSLFEQGNLDESIADFRSAIRLDSTYAKAHNGLGNVYRKKGLLSEAFQCYKKAARLEPRQALYHHNLGLTSCDMALYDIAVLALEDAVMTDAQSSDIRFDLGSAYYLKGDLAQAIRTFENFLEIAPDSERVPEIQAKIKGLRRKLEEKRSGADTRAKPKKPPKKSEAGEA